MGQDQPNLLARLLAMKAQDVSRPYQTNLSPADEIAFRMWQQGNNIPFDPRPQADYDMRGFYKAAIGGDPSAKTAISASDGMPHFPDTFKTPYHHTFSQDSMYATPDAPRWDGMKLVKPNGDAVFLELPMPGKDEK